MVSEKISKIDRLFGNKIWMQFAGKSFILILVYILLLPLLVNISGNILVFAGNVYFENIQNSGNPHKVKIDLANDGSDFLVSTVYYDEVLPEGGNPQKNLEINIRNEVLNPIAVFVIIFIAFPILNRFPKKAFFTSLLIILAFISFKLFALVYDNYNIPEYALADLVFFLHYPVYFFNMALASLGTSINYAFPAILALISNYSFLEEKFIEKNI